MNVALFCHSILSDWGHGHAHFLRGIVRELVAQGHGVRVFEPSDAWSARKLIDDAGEAALHGLRGHYPPFTVWRYTPGQLHLDAALEGVELVMVHEWNSPELVRELGQHRLSQGRYRLLFHDTHHRMLSAPEELAAYDFSGYDAVLAFGEALRERYLERGWGRRAFTWHEAADVALFQPHPEIHRRLDVVWIGNWGADDRSRELNEFLLEPVRELGVDCEAYGVRYPDAARQGLRAAGARYSGWLPNYLVPRTLARARLTVHVPRAPYSLALTGIPTIRPFEALACGVPLLSAPWSDSEGLFRSGRDYVVARNGAEMRNWMRAVLSDRALAEELAASGRETILRRHTCRHRVDELLQILRAIGAERNEPPLSEETAPIPPEDASCQRSA